MSAFLLVVLACWMALFLHSVCEAQMVQDAASHSTDLARRHVQEITGERCEYIIVQGGTMDGRNCSLPVGSWQPAERTWESNRMVRIENVGETDVVNPWLSNGQNDFRNLREIVAAAVEPGMSEEEKALALYHLEVAHRFHASTGDGEASDPVKIFNVYGYTTCGNDSVCLAGLWRRAGLQTRPARLVGHCVTQVFYDGRWHLMDADMQALYLLRDNQTVAGEEDLVRDHDLIKRTHTQGILSRNSRAKDEWEAGVYVYEGNAGGTRDAAARHTMDMALRPGEALTWRWGKPVPLRFHGPKEITIWGQRAADSICNGLWEYQPDLAGDIWRKGTDSVDGVVTTAEGLAADHGQTGTIVWRVRSPYVFVGGRLDVEGIDARFSVSWDGESWQETGSDLDALFPSGGAARYQYYLRCVLSHGARLRHLGIVNDVQMALLGMPGMAVGENRFVYTDECSGRRAVRVTHHWVERSASRPPQVPPAPVSPADGGQTNGTDVVFRWAVPGDVGDDENEDYHFELSDRSDMKWPLSPNFSKLISRTGDRGKPQYTLPYVGLLTPDREYYWRVRARNSSGVWGSWSETWRFTACAPAPPVDVAIRNDPVRGVGILGWKPNPMGHRPVGYRIYGSDEKGFTVSDEPYEVFLGNHAAEPSNPFPANFVAETSGREFVVVGAGLDLPNANKAHYRVVAVDEHGNRSGSSDYASAPRPFIYSNPRLEASVGTHYLYQVSCIRALGDLRLRFVNGEETHSFWDIERPRFALQKGPDWLEIEEETGLLEGTPDVAGKVEVVVSVTLEREDRELDDLELSWGREKVLGTSTERVGTVTQAFQVDVRR